VKNEKVQWQQSQKAWLVRCLLCNELLDVRYRALPEPPVVCDACVEANGLIPPQPGASK
jgi:hypothetical protein